MRTLQDFERAAEANRAEAIEKGLTPFERRQRSVRMRESWRTKAKTPVTVKTMTKTIAPPPRRRTTAADLPPIQNYEEDA